MKKIKVHLTPKEWAEKRFSLLIADISNPDTFIGEDAMDDYIEQCGFYLLEETQSETKPDEVPTDKVEAVKYFLNQLPDGYRERALAQVDERRIKNMPLASDLSEALFCFSRWDDTKEGDGFWHQVYNHYQYPNQYPTLPLLPNE